MSSPALGSRNETEQLEWRAREDRLNREMTKRRKLRRMLGHGLAYLALIVISIWSLVPLVWALAASVTPREAIFENANPFSWRAFWPQHPTLAAYQSILLSSAFPRALGNTIFVCAVTVLAGLLINSLAGFAFALFDFPGRTILFFFVLITFMVPFEILGIPLYIMVTDVHLTNTYQALIIPFVANGLVVFLFRQFYATLPKDLLDAGRIDGLSWFGIYRRIVVPLSVPVMISAGIILFLSQWESFFWPLLVATTPDIQMVQVVLAEYRGQYGSNWDQLFSESIVIVVIPAIILLVLQRYFVTSVATTGIKE